MIDFLVLGTSRDINVHKVLTRLRERGVRCELIDANGDTHLTLYQAPGQDVEISVNGDSVSDVCLIWNRTKLWPGSPFYFVGQERDDAFGSGVEWRVLSTFRVGEWSAICHLITTLRAQHTVNNPHIAHCMHKVAQQAVANKLGLPTPQTLVTTAKDSAMKFLASGGEHIVKPTGANFFSDWSRAEDETMLPRMMLTQLITEADVRNASAEQVAACPHMFQQRIQKSYELRVVVIATAVFAFRINSTAREYTRVDWRTAAPILSYERITLPDEIASKLVGFMKCFDLFSGSFDLIVDGDGQYWFLECNQEGVWSWLDDVTGGEIAEALANAFEQKIKQLREKRSPSDLSRTLGKLSYLCDPHLTGSSQQLAARRA